MNTDGSGHARLNIESHWDHQPDWSSDGIAVSVNGLTLTAAVTDLMNGTSYTFTVKATNSSGSSASSIASSAVVPSS
jgi:hypothetical protein